MLSMAITSIHLIFLSYIELLPGFSHGGARYFVDKCVDILGLYYSGATCNIGKEDGIERRLTTAEQKLAVLVFKREEGVVLNS